MKVQRPQQILPASHKHAKQSALIHIRRQKHQSTEPAQSQSMPNARAFFLYSWGSISSGFASFFPNRITASAPGTKRFSASSRPSLASRSCSSGDAVVLKLLSPDADDVVSDDVDDREDVGGGSERHLCAC